MTWWGRLSIARRIALVTLVACFIGLAGSFIWDYSVRPLILVICAINLFNFVGLVRTGLSAPVPGRPELSKTIE